MTEPTIDEVEPVLCEHGWAEGHFYSKGDRYGAFCRGPDSSEANERVTRRDVGVC